MLFWRDGGGGDELKTKNIPLSFYKYPRVCLMFGLHDLCHVTICVTSRFVSHLDLCPSSFLAQTFLRGISMNGEDGRTFEKIKLKNLIQVQFPNSAVKSETVSLYRVG